MEATFRHLPVTDLAAHPTNLRDDLGDIDGLTASVLERGVIEPLVVVPLDDGGHRVLAGHRRLAAAVGAGLDTVPCWTRPDLTGDGDQLVTMIVENLHRTDLTAAETAKAYEQLALLGVSDTKAAKATGTKRSWVTKARRDRIGTADWRCSTCYATVSVGLIDREAGRLPCGHDLGMAPAEFRVDVDEWTVRWLMARAVTPTLATALQQWGASWTSPPSGHHRG